MAPHRKTFGDNLIHFVRSIDIVDTSTKDSILGIIESYLREKLNVRFFNFYVESLINRQLGLRQTDWCRGGGSRDSFSIRNEEGMYWGHVCLAYDKGMPLWIVCEEGKPLRSCDNYKDLFKNAKNADIPQYVRRTEHEILTSVIRPVKDGDRIYGVVNFESIDYLEYSISIADELRKISESMSTLFLLNKGYEKQKKNTKQEIDYLSELKNSHHSSLHFSRPKVFVAFSGTAESDVIASLREVLDEYNQSIEPVYWDRIAESGLITRQILNTISTSQYGICYLSEPSKQTDHYQYEDNKNVLIEAGMLSSLSHQAEFDNWLPIRERESDTMPFDFLNNRTLTVPRLDGNVLNVEKFKLSLQTTIESWIEFSD